MQKHNLLVRCVLLAAFLVLSAKRASCLHSIPSQGSEAEEETNNKSNSNNKSNNNNSSGAGKIPFVGPTFQYQDPFAKGFEITARVYTDPHDTLAHFDEKDDASLPKIVLPYWECGVSGSTTVSVPLSSLTVRHLLGGSKPGSFETGCGDTTNGRGVHDDTHPRLVVPLTSLEIVLTSGETRIFHPGDVVLLENCLTGGHILHGHEGQDMVVMLLTLPRPYHHSGKDQNSLSSVFENTFWKQNPCKTGLVYNKNNNNNNNNNNSNNGGNTSLEKMLVAPWSSRLNRRIGLGIIGAGLSVALADFLGKVAPLALALAAGGGLVVAGGTYGVVRLGEFGLDELDFWHERRLLRLQDSSSSTTTIVDDDDDAEGIAEES